MPWVILGPLVLGALASLLAAATAAFAQSSAAEDDRIPSVIDLSDGVERVYKTVGGAPLKLYIFAPEDHASGERLPAILFFFGGGWVNGQPTQFVPQSHYLASRGMVAIPVDYRVRRRFPDATWFDGVADAKDAIRWVRRHADELGIDPDRIVASGGSAGGHLAAATALVDDSALPAAIDGVSGVPNALVLFNPAVDLTHFYNRFEDDPRWIENATSISPIHQVRGNAPPALVLHGTDDRTVPIAQAEQFCAAMRDAGNHCELEAYPGARHGFFQYGRDGNVGFWGAVRRMDAFLTSLGYLPEKPANEEAVQD